MSLDKERALGKAIQEVAQALGIELRKEGLWYKALCPFHRERTPSFGLNPRTNQYVCFGCRASGDVIDLVRKVKKLGFQEAIQYLLSLKVDSIIPEPHAMSGVTSPERKRVLEFLWGLYKDPYGNGLRYLNSRGISSSALSFLPVKYHHDTKGIGRVLSKTFNLEDLYKAGVYVESKFGPYYVLEKYPILFPSFWRGELIALRGRSIPKDELNEDHTRRWITLFGGGSGKAINADSIRMAAPSEPVHITEGPTDLVSLRELILQDRFKSIDCDPSLKPHSSSPLVAIPSVTDLDNALLNLLVGRKVVFWIDAGAEPLKFLEKFRIRGKAFKMTAINARSSGLLPGAFKDVNEYLKFLKSDPVQE